MAQSKNSLLHLLKTLIALVALSYSGLILAEEKIPKKLVEVSLFTFEKQSQHYLAVAFKNAQHWHTYWSNPGDAGLPTTVKFSGLEVKELPWPTPKQFTEAGDIVVFGYENQYTRFFQLPKNLPSSPVTIQSHWLVCKHVCIPGSFDQKVNFSSDYQVSGYQNPFSLSKNDLLGQLDSLPKEQPFPPNVKIEFIRNDSGAIELQTQISNTPKIEKNSNFFLPFRSPLITFKRETSQYKDNNYYLTYSLEWDGIYEEPPIELPKSGALKKPLDLKFLYFAPNSSSPIVIKKTFTELKKKTSDLGTKSSSLEVLNKKKEDNSLVFYLLLAFLGGIILNVMPCVLPVISIKLFSLASHSDESNKMIFKHNIAYTLGVLFSFFVLASIIYLLKSTGQSVGWGFQLQSPYFVALMILGLTLFAFNLFGLFEFSTPGGKTLGNVQLKDGFVGDFLGGVLATILSTPCSAPFLGTALTFAFSGSTLIIYVIFLSIGLGLSFPFLLTAFFPQAVKSLPRPGLWMEKVKKFLGFTLILTVVWLLDVFETQTTQGNLFKLLGVLSFFFFAFYFQAHISKSKWKYFFHLLPIMMTSFIFIKGDFTQSLLNEDSLLERKQHKGLQWEKWSEEKTLEYASQGQVTFIDFTASWCLTCKVNEKLVLETKKFKELVQKHQIKLLLGDWTRNDPKISAFLKKHGFVGVPAYFLINKEGQLVILGETVSIKEIKKNLTL